MKTFRFLFAAFLMAFTFAACSSGDNDENGGGNNQPEQPEESTPIKVKVSVLEGAYDLDHPVPRLVAEWGDNMFAQVVDPAHPDVTMFQYMNSNEAFDAVAVVTEHNIIIMHYNPTSGKDFPKEALVASDNDDFTSLSSCTINWETGEIDYGETIPFITDSKAKTRVAEVSTRGENDFIINTFFNMFDFMSEKIDQIKEQVEKFGALGRSATTLCQAWTKVLIPLMKYQLFADDEIGQKKYITDLFTSQLMDVIEGKINGKVDDAMDELIDYLCEITGVDKEDVNLLLWAYDNFKRPKNTTDDKPTGDTGSYVGQAMSAASSFSAKVNAGAPVFKEAHVNPNSSVQVSLNIRDVGKTSISLGGSVKLDDSSYASYISAGFIAYVNGTEKRLQTRVDDRFNIEAGTLSNLESGTKYSVVAYYETLGKIFYSSRVDVVTKGTLFELSEQKIESEAKGGQKAIKVKTGYETTWSVKSKPQWCTCTQQGNTLQVNVSENTGDARTGKIVLEVQNYYKEKTTQTIDVTQEAAENDDDEGDDDDDDDDDDNKDDTYGWYGTTWTFTGNLTINDSDEGVSSGSVTITLNFPTANSVNMSTGLVNEFDEIWGMGRTKVEETANGLIITNTGSYTDTDEEGSSTMNWNHKWVLRHTDATHATLEWSGQHNDNGWYYIGKERYSYSGTATFSGHFTGTRTK